MADTKISGLGAAGALGGTEAVPVVQTGTTVKTTAQDIADLFDASAYAPLTAPTFATSITGSFLTASEMLVTDANKKIVSAPVATYPSLTELSYVKGLTSAIQTQLGNKVETSVTVNGHALNANVTVTKADVGLTNVTDDIQVKASLIDAKGDVLVGSADNTPAKLGVGANDTVLTAASGEATGLAFKVIPRTVSIYVVEAATNTAIGDGKAYFVIPAIMNGYNLIAAHARVITAGTTNTTDIQIRNVTQTADMLSTKLTIDSTETGSDTGTAYAIDTSNDDVATNDLIAIDIDAVSTTAAKGLIVTLTFGL